MRYRLLGPLEVWDGARWVTPAGRKQRALLAILLVYANQPVPTEHLIEELWHEHLPRGAANLLQVYVSRLRKLLNDETARGDKAGTHGLHGSESTGILRTRSSGYELMVQHGDLDIDVFERLAQAGQQALGAGSLQAAVEHLTTALTLWRGQPLADVPATTTVAAHALRLQERRLTAVEARLEAELGLGLHAEVLPALKEQVAAYPLREGLWAHLMVALYRSGRQAEALRAYRDLHRTLHDELGIEPNPSLQRLERAILTNDPALALQEPVTPDQRAAAEVMLGRWSAGPVPCQLPPDIGDFTGRHEPLTRLRGLLDGEPGSHTTSVVVCAISGAAGVGKTALAIHAAHLLAERFPDGQLYVNLQGATSGLRPLQPLAVLGRFLRALGVEASAIPTDVDEAAARFRSQVASHRLMVVLDNAHDAAQVAPLLPASSMCAVLVTSRRRLASLDGAHHLHLGMLPEQEAVEFLGRLAGQQRIAGEPQAATQLARWCGGLPLALRIAGARLAARPGWPVVALAERLADAQRRLDELELAELGIRASFQVSYQELAASADPLDRAGARAFSVLGVLDSPDVDGSVAARLLDQPQQVAERVLERLVDAHLLETPSRGRYRLHDLLRLYSRELARELYPEHERAVALSRAFGFYVAAAWRTLALLRPGDYRLARADSRWSDGGLEFADDTAALGWLEAERANLLAAVQQAAASPGVPDAIAVQLAQALFGFFLVHSYWQDWVRVNQTAVLAARRVGDRAGEAQANNDLGVAYWRLGQYDQALTCHQQSLAMRRQLGDAHGQAASLGNLGLVHEQQGRYDQALACLQESLAIDRELENRFGQASSLGNLGWVYERQGRYERALACLQESLAIRRELGDRFGQAAILNDLGIVYQRQEGCDQALACLQESLTIDRELSDRYAQATSLNDIGIIHQRQGRYDQALACQQESLTIRRELGDPHGQAETLRELGITLRTLGRPGEAQTHWQQALAIFEQLQSADADQVRALLAAQPTSATRSTAG
jgi:tetratricopeptide (TPR) repeat protein/DNA-binding SARP family transcriptional activator